MDSMVIDISNSEEITTNNEPNCHITSILLLLDRRLAFSTNKKEIQIYGIQNNYHCDINITNTGHTDKINSLCQLDNGKLMSCSWDESIKIWILFQFSYQCEFTINNAHNFCIYQVKPLTSNRFASCSYDKTIKIWNSNHPYNILATLQGHTYPVFALVQLKRKETLISGAKYNSLRSWDLSIYQCTTIINKVECCYKNSMIEIDNQRIVVGGLNKITIINTDKYMIEHIIQNDKLDYVYSLMKLRNGNILCGCEYGIMCIYDIHKESFLFINEAKSNNCDILDLFQINEHQFISSANVIKKWNY